MRKLGIPLGDIHDFSSQEVQQLLHNKFIVIMGDSNYRSIYKDLIYFLQKEKKLTLSQLKKKGEETFANDCRVEFEGLKDGTDYREARQYRASHHLVRFYFITRVYSSYMESILSDLKKGLESGLTPDVVIMNSCIWDLNRYHDKFSKEPPIPKAIREYRQNLEKLFARLDDLLPPSCLIIWVTALPDQCNSTPQNVIEANFYSASLAWCYHFNVLDLHYCFRLLEDLHAEDGVHWNYWAHRCITKLLLTHVAGAWEVELAKRKPQMGIEQDGDEENQDFYSREPLPQMPRQPLGQSHCGSHPCPQPGDGYFSEPLGGSEEYWEDPPYPGLPNSGHGPDFPHGTSYMCGPVDRYGYEGGPLPCPAQLCPSNGPYILDDAHFVHGPPDYWDAPSFPGQAASFQFNADFVPGPMDGGDYEPPALPYIQPGNAPYFLDDGNFVNGPVGGSGSHQGRPPYPGQLNPGCDPSAPCNAGSATGPEGRGERGQCPPPHPSWLHPGNACYIQPDANGSRGPRSSFEDEQGPLPPWERIPVLHVPRSSCRRARAGRSDRFLVRHQPSHSLRDQAHPYAWPLAGSGNPLRSGRFRPSRRPWYP